MIFLFLIFAWLRITQQSLLYGGYEPLIRYTVDISPFSRLLNRSTCVLSSGDEVDGQSDCKSGEIFLIGKLMNVGIHNVASFGTQNLLLSSYMNEHLSMISDYSMNGWNISTVPFPNLPFGAAKDGPKDFFTPGGPYEGNTIEWIESLLGSNDCNFFRLDDSVQQRRRFWLEHQTLFAGSGGHDQFQT
jgi:hypothetical protein